jgi:GMP synthase-like glutamine amidotransferase
LKNPPSADEYDALWVMGGPMNVWEENRYPWLVKEKLFIKNWVMNLEKPFFGICLGHQLLGEALGASVVKSQTPEIGFRKISVNRLVHTNNLLSNFSDDMLVLQGHSAEISNFSKKEVSVLASSDNCSIQALSYLNHAFSVQFHPEVVDETIRNWISIPKIGQDFHNTLGEKGIEGIIDYQKKNRRSLINGAKLIYENWLNLIEKN